MADKKTVWCFGDSWMYGQGSQFEPGGGVLPTFVKYDEKYEPERQKYSIPAKLNKLVGNSFNFENLGSCGSSNFQIYSNIITKIKNNKIKKDDICIVMWSSILREPLHFFSNGVDLGSSPLNSMKTLRDINNISFGEIDNSYKKIFKDYLVHRLDYNFFYYICMNYVSNLQILLEDIGVKYVFANAFENIISNDISFYGDIKKENWVLWESTFSDYLSDIEPTLDQSLPYTLWEDDFKYPGRNHDGPHPNRIGYDMIAQKIHEHLKLNIL